MIKAFQNSAPVSVEQRARDAMDEMMDGIVRDYERAAWGRAWTMAAALPLFLWASAFPEDMLTQRCREELPAAKIAQPNFKFKAGGTLSAGNSFTFACSYTNPDEKDTLNFRAWPKEFPWPPAPKAPVKAANSPRPE